MVVAATERKCQSVNRAIIRTYNSYLSIFIAIINSFAIISFSPKICSFFFLFFHLQRDRISFKTIFYGVDFVCVSFTKKATFSHSFFFFLRFTNYCFRFYFFFHLFASIFIRTNFWFNFVIFCSKPVKICIVLPRLYALWIYDQRICFLDQFTQSKAFTVSKVCDNHFNSIWIESIGFKTHRKIFFFLAFFLVLTKQTEVKEEEKEEKWEEGATNNAHKLSLSIVIIIFVFPLFVCYFSVDCDQRSIG